MKFVSVILGNKSDYETMKYSVETFDKFDVKYEIIVSSALKSPKRTEQYVLDAEKKGAVIFITASKVVSHLAGMVSALTTKPVISHQTKDSNADESFSSVCTPAGIPVCNTTLGETGAINAAYFAMQILAITDKELAVKLKEDRIIQSKKIETDSKSIEVIL
ncbi:5-(carboxyamino)imidazole ribonucleotide mutase [Halarcobacter bivalviorum]|uniref:N5-carboxyaminoimidazole ribonucleotide mutase n=1 Tax=Halarcobacter bivalviorum TaxID=663364 RepID=A0AAX2A7P1_9BACT|nr:5-(carboxyamino)imidazole ribonucleotide mutase [Halarcobacter bivalviorum]AXH11457.1 5-aminoimidazole ribonucleotide (AIR) carboxylase [Halarcobacter bivalviorum]RXK05330.1 5-(carboxyamino)imidazole ribonucleotide mutase [Halarcobacter bivalviorum]RXK09358.1 5-(carboxyamino)imidazole ribonucleotide mutase [Halarcobacter bivalviorum]